jgi:predicted RNA binding protein YcfA (HicA-like mRNA interferase family)
MSKHLKALAKLRARPVPVDFKWDELKGVLEHLGYQMLKNSGSRRKFVHSKTKALIICHEPHPSPNVDKGCIVDVISHLEANGFM